MALPLRRLSVVVTLVVWLAGCAGGRGPVTPPDDPDPDPPDPPAKTASIRLVEGMASMPAGTSVVVGEEFNTEGLVAVEWDLSYDGTNFTVDLSRTPPTSPAPPVRVALAEPGSRTIALRGRYPGDVLSPVATLTLTIAPATTAQRFAPESRDVGELVYEDPVLRGVYTNVQAGGGHSIAVNDDRLAIGYWAIEDRQPGYFVTCAPDGGGRWSAPIRVSSEAIDSPNINREPQIALCPAGQGFLAVWMGAGEADLRSSTIWVAPDPLTVSLTPLSTIVLPGGTTLATSPALFTDPADPTRGRLLAGCQLPAGNRLALIPWSISGTALTWSMSEASPLNGLPVRIRGAWTGPIQLVSLEERKVTLGGGTGGGGQTSVEVSVDLATIAADGHVSATEFLSKSGQPAQLLAYESTLACTADRFLFAWIEEGQPPFVEGGLSLAGGTYDESGATVEAFYAALTAREDIGNLAAVATADSFVLAYTLPRLDVDPLINTNRSEELYAARFPLLPGDALYFDDPINRGDPDGNEGLEQPSLAVDGSGTVYASWAESNWNKKALGRVGFNRTG